MTTLAASAMAALRTFFDQRDHHPSLEHWTALRAIAETLENMAEGRCDPHVFLSACDPGVGKSQTVVRFAHALAASEQHRHVGMLVCVGRIEEARTLATALRDINGKVAVLVREGDPVNDLGGEAPEQAQVLITTQQRIARATERRTFGEVSSLHYRGMPRQVRAWDEEMRPGLPIALNGDDMAFLLKPARRISAEFHATLFDFIQRLATTRTNDLMDVPDLQRAHEITLDTLLAEIGDGDGKLRDDQHAAAQSLFALSGHTARVWRDNRDGSAVLHYEDTLPDDLKPLLVLDASGRVRHMYADLERHRGLVRLPHAAKDYAPLTINVWRRGGGKTSLRAHGEEITKGIVAAIAAKPAKEWLIVAHKKENGRGGIKDMHREVTRRLPSEVREKVRTITWGQHMASNLYAEVPNVILAGSLFMRESYYLALTHMAQARPTDTGFAHEDDVALTRLGEHANGILQALCRGRVRKLNGDQCFPMTAYIVASQRSGIPDALTWMFPGAVVQDWRPFKRALTGKPKEALEAVQRQLAAGATWIPFAFLARTIDMRPENFRKHVSKNHEWLDAAHALGLIVSEGARKAKGLRKAALMPDVVAA